MRGDCSLLLILVELQAIIRDIYILNCLNLNRSQIVTLIVSLIHFLSPVVYFYGTKNEVECYNLNNGALGENPKCT